MQQPNLLSHQSLLQTSPQSAVIWANLTHIPCDDRLRQYLPDHLRRVNTSQNQRVQQRDKSRILGYFLLAQLLDFFCLPKQLLTCITRTTSGRPYFAGHGNIDFNISHSGDWVAVILSFNRTFDQILSPAKAVAIDIEHPQKSRDFDKLIQSYSLPKEYAWFNHQNDKVSAFYRTWCLREAVLKSQGAGIVQLKNVLHDPYQLQINTDYAPPGNLYWCEHLPFYLAYFIEHAENMRLSIFEWQDKMLPTTSLTIQYQVNFITNLPQQNYPPKNQ